MSNIVEDIVKVMDEVKRFVECDFALGAEGDDSGIRPPHK